MNAPVNITTRPEEIYGYAVQIEMPHGRTIWKYWKVRHLSQARYRGGLVAGAVRVVNAFPVNKEGWDAAHAKR